MRALGGACPRLLVVACEPLTFGGEDGAMGLSAPVAAAVDPAVAAVEELVGDCLPAGKDHAMSGCWKLAIGALILVVIAANAKDLARYIKISSM